MASEPPCTGTGVGPTDAVDGVVPSVADPTDDAPPPWTDLLEGGVLVAPAAEERADCLLDCCIKNHSHFLEDFHFHDKIDI